jgi:tetrahydromethanopterin S-methyltransferase subunit H
MFKFKTPQKIFQVGKVRVGGQPGELPTVLIGTIFYIGHKIVEDQEKGVFDKAKAEELIKRQDEWSATTGNPCVVDVVCPSLEAARKYIDFVAGVTDAPIMIDVFKPEIKFEVLKYVREAGLSSRVIYNSIMPYPREDEIVALKESKVESAILLVYNVKDRTSKGVLSMLKGDGGQKGLLKYSEEAGITKPLIDTTIFTYVPSIGVGSKACFLVKDELGLPVGGAPGNATNKGGPLWKKIKSWGLDIFKACEATSQAIPIAFGADFLLYGIIEAAPWVFPACAMIDAMVATVAKVEYNISPLTKEHPLYKIFPEFVEKLEKAGF